jgi:hypothetical protein
VLAATSGGTPLPADVWGKIEEQVRRRVPVRDDFVTISFPRLAGTSDGQLVAAVESYQREAAVVDDRLAREVTLERKAEALSDLCERLRTDTGIRLTAGRSVADEKVTVFCQKRPLREVMRQLSRPFGYTWLRTKAPPAPPKLGGTGAASTPPAWGGTEGAGEYRYELVQDLRSQLLEEELRNRDRHEALLALDQEMSQYRQYFGLTPDEALARAKTAPPAERRWLERYAGTGWGPAQMYFRLSPQDVARLRVGERVTFSIGPTPSEQALPPELAQGVRQSLREARLRREGDLFVPVREPESSAGMPPAALPEVRPKATLELTVSDLGQFTLIGGTGVNLNPIPGDGRHWLHEDELAVGISPSVRNPRNGAANARLARDASLRPRVSVAPAGHELRTSEIRGDAIITTRGRVVTSADLLEALHRATGMPVVGDYYTLLFPASTAAVKDQSLFAGLNQLCDAMRLRWNKEGDWLQFRSASHFHDRLKEVPNRLLRRWAASRKTHGALTLEDVVEIAQLPDTQLDAGSMAEGARELHGLAEWDLARRPALRAHLRYLAGMTAAQRQETVSPGGLAFTRMSLPQQQQFIALAFGRGSSQLQSLEELRGGTVRVDYVLPGNFEWRQPEAPAAGSERKPPGEDRIQRMLQPPPVRARTREAVLQAARRIDPQVPEAQIIPTRPELAVIYTPGPGSRFKPGGVRATLTSTLNFTVSPRTGPDPR